MKLAKTADGKTIRNGSVVFVTGPWVAHCERVSYDEDGILRSDYDLTIFPGGLVDPSVCFSSLSAARKKGKTMKRNNARRNFTKRRKVK